MYLKRDIEEKILEASKTFASITIYGSRDIGKLTLIENLFPNIDFFFTQWDNKREFR